MAELNPMDPTDELIKIPGRNNASYGPIPKASQLFEIEFLDIAPLPILADETFFTLLRGRIPASKQGEDPSRLNELLTNAIVTISLSAVLADGTIEEGNSYTIPFRTTEFNNHAHIAIRTEEGTYIEHLGSSGTHDIITDCALPSPFIKTGSWTFKIVVKLEDGTCLFAVTLTQWLKGGMGSW